MRYFVKIILHTAASSIIGFCLVANFYVANAQTLDEQRVEEIIENEMMNVVCATCNQPLGYVAYKPLSAGYFDHVIFSNTLTKDHDIYRCEICKTPLFEASDLVYSANGQLTFSQPLNLLKMKYDTYHIALPPIAKRPCSFCRDSASQNEFYEPGIVFRLR